MKQPTDEQVEQAMALLKTPAHAAYFFDNLDNPFWLPALLKGKQFDIMPAPAQDKKRKTISFPDWPLGRYLARVAGSAPEEALVALQTVPETDNPRSCEYLLEAASKLPIQIPKDLGEKIIRWAVGANTYWQIKGATTDLIKNLVCATDQFDLALRVADAIFALSPDGSVAENPDSEYALPPRPRGDLEAWYYQEALKELIPILEGGGALTTIQLLADLLDRAITLSRASGTEGQPDDHSFIWRPAIEDHEQNLSGSDYPAILVEALRDSLERLNRDKAISVADTLRILESKNWWIFTRIKIHLFRLFPDRFANQIEPVLLNRDYFDESYVKHEYSRLLSQQARKMNRAAVETVSGWIEVGPDLARWSEWVRREKDREPSPEELQGTKDHWQNEKLEWFLGGLPKRLKKLRSELVKKYGEPEHPDFASYSSSWVGPSSPHSTEELASMSGPEILAFLAEWRPAGKGYDEPTMEGLGRILEQIGVDKLNELVVDFGALLQLDPTYLSSILRGLGNTLDSNENINWDVILDVCLFVAKQEGDDNEQWEDRGRDPGWSWSKKAALDVISKGMAGNRIGIPLDRRDKVWSILALMLEVGDPDLEALSYSELESASINTVYGEAIHASIKYGLWVHRSLVDNERPTTFEDFDELRVIFDERLGLETPIRPLINSVMGQWFPWLVLLDKDWAADNTNKIFPIDRDQRELWNAAWLNYLRFCRPYNDVYPVLRDCYEHAIRLLPEDESEDDGLDGEDRIEQLASHIMVFYLRGLMDDEDNSPLLTAFWQADCHKLQVNAINFLGRSLGEDGLVLNPQLEGRFVDIWESRRAIFDGADDREVYKDEMRQFGQWFVSGKLQALWSITQLEYVVRQAGSIEPKWGLLERLSTLSAEFPFQSAWIFGALCDQDEFMLGGSDAKVQARTLLSNALASDNPEAGLTVTEVINRLGARGNHSFRDLLD